MPVINHEPTGFDKEIALLESVGISTKKTGKIEDRFQHEMVNGGLGPEEVVGTIAQIMNSGENSSVKLAAAKIALSMYMHPAFVPRKEAEKSEMPVININVQNGDVKLDNIFTPKEMTRES